MHCLSCATNGNRVEDLKILINEIEKMVLYKSSKPEQHVRCLQISSTREHQIKQPKLVNMHKIERQYSIFARMQHCLNFYVTNNSFFL